MKTAFKIIFFTLFFGITGAAIVSLFVPALSHAQVQITASIPGKYNTAATSTVPGQFVYNIYQYALIIGGILAFAVVVYGGIRYMISAGNPSGQTDAKDWIKAAIMGILLLGGAYFVLNIINPNLTNLTLPTLDTINLGTYSGGPNGGTGGGAGGGAGGGNGTGLSQAVAQQDLAAAGIGVSSTGHCDNPNDKNCTSLQGMQQDTINELVKLKSDCGCSITVTGGTETGHGTGVESHANGYKADIDPNSQVSNYITSNSNFSQINNRSSDNAQQWKDNSTGAIYARESNHWDIVVP